MFTPGLYQAALIIDKEENFYSLIFGRSSIPQIVSANLSLSEFSPSSSSADISSGE